MKNCHFCAECIQDDAIKCRFCGEIQPLQKKKEPWYLTPGMMIVAFCCVGPLMLPMVWIHPAYARKTKIVWTIVVLVLSWIMFQAFFFSLGQIKQYYGLWLGNSSSF